MRSPTANLIPYTCTGCGEVLRNRQSIGTHAMWSKTCTPQMRFWSKVDKSAGPDACWPWTAWCNPRFGYGMSAYKGESIAASKVAWIFTHGEPAKGEHVCHNCDNPICCNPAHFFLGSHRQNMQDMHLKGRNGKKNTLTPEQVREIRELAKTMRSVDIAKLYGVHSPIVSGIKHGKKYRFVQ